MGNINWYLFCAFWVMGALATIKDYDDFYSHSHRKTGFIDGAFIFCVWPTVWLWQVYFGIADLIKKRKRKR